MTFTSCSTGRRAAGLAAMAVAGFSTWSLVVRAVLVVRLVHGGALIVVGMRAGVASRALPMPDPVGGPTVHLRSVRSWVTPWLLDMEVLRDWGSAGLLLRHRSWVEAMPRSGAANPLIPLGCVVQTLAGVVGGRLDLQCWFSVDTLENGFLFDLDW